MTLTMTRTLTLLAALSCALSATANALDEHVEAVIRIVEGAKGKVEKTEDGQRRRVLALRPDDAAANSNLDLCEELLRNNNGTALPRPLQLKLLAALRAQGRLLDAAPFERRNRT